MWKITAYWSNKWSISFCITAKSYIWTKKRSASTYYNYVNEAKKIVYYYYTNSSSFSDHFSIQISFMYSFFILLFWRYCLRFLYFSSDKIVNVSHLSHDCFIFLHNHHHPLSQCLVVENKHLHFVSSYCYSVCAVTLFL